MAREAYQKQERKTELGLPLKIEPALTTSIYPPFEVPGRMARVVGPQPELSPRLLTHGLSLEAELQRVNNFERMMRKFESPADLANGFVGTFANLTKRVRL